jgi:hypothetical protein
MSRPRFPPEALMHPADKKIYTIALLGSTKPGEVVRVQGILAAPPRLAARNGRVEMTHVADV